MEKLKRGKDIDHNIYDIPVGKIESTHLVGREERDTLFRYCVFHYFFLVSLILLLKTV